jgi:hypothetical protein
VFRARSVVFDFGPSSLYKARLGNQVQPEAM